MPAIRLACSDLSDRAYQCQMSRYNRHHLIIQLCSSVAESTLVEVAESTLIESVLLSRQTRSHENSKYLRVVKGDRRFVGQ